MGGPPCDGRHSLMTKLSQITEKIVLFDGRHNLWQASHFNEKIQSK